MSSGRIEGMSSSRIEGICSGRIEGMSTGWNDYRLPQLVILSGVCHSPEHKEVLRRGDLDIVRAAVDD